MLLPSGISYAGKDEPNFAFFLERPKSEECSYGVMETSQLIVKPELSESYRGLRVLELELYDLKVRESNRELDNFKIQKQNEIRANIESLEVVKNLPILRAYRDFYWKVGIDPTKTRPAGEALIRRILGGKDLPRINTLVDAYNIASAETQISIAAFDLDAVDRSNLEMRLAQHGEAFLGIGMQKPIQLTGVEVVIEDLSAKKLIAVYPYRDSDESKVTLQTDKVLLMMCGVPGIGEEDLLRALQVTKEHVEKYCSH